MSQTDSSTTPIDDVTVLSRNTEITGGKLKVAHDLTVRGVIEGEVRVGGRVVVAAGASVIGLLQAREAIIAGSVRGEVVVEETLTLRSTAVVDGAARAARLIVEEGSSGDVNLHVGDQKSFELMERRRREARVELDRVRSRSGINGSGRDDRADPQARRKPGGSHGWSRDVAVTSPEGSAARARSSEELLASEEIREMLPGEPGPDDGHAARIGDGDRASK